MHSPMWVSGLFYSLLVHFGLLKGTSQKYVDPEYDIIILLFYQSCEVFTDYISGFHKLTPWRSLLLPVTNDQKRVTARRQVFYSKLKMPLPASGTRFLDWKHNVRFEDLTQEAGGCRSITPLVRTLRWPRRIGWCKRLWADNITKRNKAWGCGLDTCGSRWGPMPGYSEHNNELSGVMNGGVFLY